MVKFGLPEILFNLFPGMGAFSFLSRKIGLTRAQKMILGGRIYSATELHEMGLIDVLADDGRGEDAVRAYIAENRHRHIVHRRIRDVNLRVRAEQSLAAAILCDMNALIEGKEFFTKQALELYPSLQSDADRLLPSAE